MSLMLSFYVRAELSYNCALEHTADEGGLFFDLVKALPKSCEAQSLMCRYTFISLRMKQKSAAECRALVEKTWNERNPEMAGELNVRVLPDEGGDRGELVKSLYSNFFGAEAYEDLVTELYHTLTPLRLNGALSAFCAQNYLFAIDAGCGFTTLLSSFGNYLQRMGAYGEDSQKRTLYSEFIIDKEGDGQRYTVDELMDELRLKDGAEEQRSVIGLDISYFLDSGKADELRRMLQRLSIHQDRLIFVFRVPYLEKKALEDIAQTLSDMMLLRVVPIPPLHDVLLLETMRGVINRNGYECDSRLNDAFLTRIRREKRDGRFYGHKTAVKIAQEMILEKARTEGAKEENNVLPIDKTILPSDLPEIVEKQQKTGYDALNELIGMEKIAARVREIAAQVKMSMANEKLDRPCIHMRFLGAPGTGKTTVARIIGQIFREEGILRKGAFMEYSSRELCAEYVGQTAVKTAAICRDSYGSVLFIDEAYALYQNDHQINDYGKEALTTLIAEMENHRDDMLVIMAGYTDDMETLMKGNAGLRSRMPYALTFESYSRQQLFDIFMSMVRKHFDYTAVFEKEAHDYFMALSESYIASKEFANARFVRNLYERTWSKAALRAALNGQKNVQLRREDFIAASGEQEFGEKIEVKNRIGF